MSNDESKPYTEPEAVAEAEKIKDILDSKVNTPEDYRLAHDFLLEDETRRPLEGKSWTEVFGSAEGRLVQIETYQEKAASSKNALEKESWDLEVQQSHLRFSQDVVRFLTRAEEESRKNLKDQPLEIDRDWLRSSYFYTALHTAANQLAAGEESEKRGSASKIMGRLLQRLTSTPDPDELGTGSVKIEIGSSERKFFDLALSIGLESARKSVWAGEVEIAATRRDIERDRDSNRVSSQLLEDDRVRLKACYGVLDDLERKTGAPQLNPKNPTVEEVRALIGWRRANFDRQRGLEGGGQNIGRGPSLGDKWALFWQAPDGDFLLLNQDYKFNYTYPHHLITYRLPGTTYAVHSEGLWMGLDPSALLIIEGGIHRRFLDAREMDAVNEKILEPRKAELASQLH